MSFTTSIHERTAESFCAMSSAPPDAARLDARTSRRRASRAGVVAITLAAVGLLVGCRKTPIERKTPIGKECPAEVLPEGAFVQRIVAGGIAGERRARTVYADGRVVEELGWPPNVTAVKLTISPERAQALEAELVRTRVFDVGEGCWEESRTVYDGMGVTLVLRHDGRVHTYSGSGMPLEVTRASALLSQFDREINEAFTLRARAAQQDGGSVE